MPAYCTRLPVAGGGGGVAQIFSGLWPHNGRSGERAARGERSLQLQSPDTSSSHTATQLEHYKHFSPRTWAEERRKTARDGEMQTRRMCWGGGVQDMYPHQRLCPLRYVRQAFQRQLCLHAIVKRPLRTFCGRKSCSQYYLAVKSWDE